MLKNKHPGVKAGDAALLILAAERQLKSNLEISAITLSKAVKASGYAPERLDRELAKAMREGQITASGTKRSRTYQITDKGLEIAWLEARKLKSQGQQASQTAQNTTKT
jgi:CTP-dependent riboflavin kinase